MIDPIEFEVRIDASKALELEDMEIIGSSANNNIANDDDEDNYDDDSDGRDGRDGCGFYDDKAADDLFLLFFFYYDL